MRKILLSLVLAGFSQQALADSYWEHNGSIIRLEARGNQRFFYYEDPSDLMRRAGVTRGTLLFNGHRDGQKYHGYSRVFSKYCIEPLEYRVSGYVSESDTKITLIGTRERYAAGCRPTGKMRKDVLVFHYLYSD